MNKKGLFNLAGLLFGTIIAFVMMAGYVALYPAISAVVDVLVSSTTDIYIKFVAKLIPLVLLLMIPFAIIYRSRIG